MAEIVAPAAPEYVSRARYDKLVTFVKQLVTAVNAQAAQLDGLEAKIATLAGKARKASA